MLFLSPILSVDRDAVVSRLCAVVVPPLLAYIGILCFLGRQLADCLLSRDTYCKKRIKVRLYGIVRTSITGGLLVFAIIYFSIHKIWDTALLFIFVLLGYSWIKINAYCTDIQYTHRYLRVRAWKTNLQIPMEEIYSMCWEGERNSIAYVLVIYCKDGKSIRLSSGDFIGLKKLKSVYDSGTFSK